MLGGERFEFSDYGASASARDFDFGTGDLDQHVVLSQRGGKRLDESKAAQVVKCLPAPFVQRGRKVLAGLIKSFCCRGLHSRGLLSDEAVHIALAIRDAESITRRSAGQP